MGKKDIILMNPRLKNFCKIFFSHPLFFSHTRAAGVPFSLKKGIYDCKPLSGLLLLLLISGLNLGAAMGAAPPSTISGSGFSAPIVIPLLTQPDASLVVPTIIDGRVMTTLMVDTGSSYTVITPRLAEKLGIVITPDTPRMRLITANGQIEAPLVTLKNVVLGTLKVPQVTAVVQELNGDDPLLSGLLGMNFFHGMDLTIKEDSLVIALRDKR